ncbi:MAG: iron-sulfur cluster assembly scaffold protein [Spirochaetales bacterium]|nr:iron-sulfur cluster assembly scaffold protein [Spirochaetales bacterium]
MTEINKDPFDKIQEAVDNEMAKTFSKKTLHYSRNPVNMGRMNDPFGSAYIKGICGDSMEIYLIIENNVITEVSFFTEGCGATVACGSAVTVLTKGKTIAQVLSLSPRDIIDHLDGLPEENIHCAILAVNTFFKAVADYMFAY